MSSFFGLNVALTALQASQYAMDITGHNIANANTEGYRRQEAVFTANLPQTSHMNSSSSTMSQLGTGVIISDIRRVQTGFIDAQVRLENQLSGMWGARSEAMEQIEPLFAEPTSAGLNATLNKFWNSWLGLAAEPESYSARSTVVASGTALADQVRSMYGTMESLQKDLDDQIASKAQEINRIVKEITTINNQTVETRSGQYQPYDLMDKRDVLIEDLAKLIDIDVYGTAGAGLTINIGGHVLVQGNGSCQIKVEPDANGFSKLTWAESGMDVDLSGGEIQGLMDVRDDILGGYMSSLDAIAITVRDRVNEIHSGGTDMYGNPAGVFFAWDATAANMRVDDTILANPSRVAAAATGTTGDRTIANDISSIRNDLIIDGRSIGDTYAGLVARVGNDVKDAQVHTDTYEASLSQRKTQRESVSGVSLDEEMANMVRFQQSYNAAARIFGIMDEMLDTVISAF